MGQPATKEKEQEEGEEAEEEEDLSPVDTKPECEESCKPRCVKQLLHYEVWKHCTGQYFDYWGCIDKCLSVSVLQSISTATLHCTISFDDVCFRRSACLGEIPDLPKITNFKTAYCWGGNHF
ncbi:hypothetical protein CY35_18G009900, partial [Sphagnum magellanicum]